LIKSTTDVYYRMRTAECLATLDVTRISPISTYDDHTVYIVDLVYKDVECILLSDCSTLTVITSTLIRYTIDLVYQDVE
jgi:hypothetical protein